MSARRVTAEAGSSTMAVYTHFGSMSGLVREIVYEGFARLQSYFTRVEQTDDPVADLAVFGRAYRHCAVTNPNLYAAMFGGASLAGFALTEDDRQHGRYTLINVVECASRCIAAQRFRETDPALAGHHMWLAVHGLVTLELGAYLVAPYDADRCFETQLVTLMVGAGDSITSATRSVQSSATRFVAETLSTDEAAEERARAPEDAAEMDGQRTRARRPTQAG